METLIIKTGSTEEFFRRGRQLARQVDQGLPIAHEHIVSFEDRAELNQLLRRIAELNPAISLLPNDA